MNPHLEDPSEISADRARQIATTLCRSARRMPGRHPPRGRRKTRRRTWPAARGLVGRERVGGEKFAKEQRTIERRGGDGEIKGYVVFAANSFFAPELFVDTRMSLDPRHGVSRCPRCSFSVSGILSD